MRVSIALRQLVGFTKRDFLSWATYRTAVMTQIIGIFIAVFSWGVGATYVQRPVAEMYNSDYISFLIVGLAVGNLILPLAQGVERQLNPWTLETIFMTGVGTPVFVIGNVLWTYIFSVISFVPYLVIGALLFHVQLHVNVLSTAVAFVISAGILIGLAMISTGVRIVTKSTDPVTWAINVLQNLFAGIMFPVIFLDTIFFPGASALSWCFPQTWVYHICRLSMLTNASLADPGTLLTFLEASAFGLVLLPVGYLVFRWGVNRAKREGTLGWY